jgi:hypothetical protein
MSLGIALLVGYTWGPDVKKPAVTLAYKWLPGTGSNRRPSD